MIDASTKARKSSVGLTLAAAFAIGCSGGARSPEAYRDDTAALLETTNEAVKSCYAEVAARHPGAQGTVALRFRVARETGVLGTLVVDRAGTTAPAVVAECVTRHVDGLVLMPGDPNDGQATFVWVFRIPPASARAKTGPS